MIDYSLLDKFLGESCGWTAIGGPQKKLLPLTFFRPSLQLNRLAGQMSSLLGSLLLSSFLSWFASSAPSLLASPSSCISRRRRPLGTPWRSLTPNISWVWHQDSRQKLLFANSTSFCQSIKEWTLRILASDNGPLVHSVSYGFQGDPGEASAVEADLVTIVACNRCLRSLPRGSHLFSALRTAGRRRAGTRRSCSSPWVTVVGSTAFVDANPGSEEMATTYLGS